MMLSDISETVNSYPDSLAMDKSGNIVNFSYSKATSNAVLLITRAFKLGEPNILKTIDTLIIRGTFRKGNVCVVLYGSLDLFNWHLIASSVDQCLRGFRGTPYKYFRIAVIGSLQKVKASVLLLPNTHLDLPTGQDRNKEGASSRCSFSPK